MKNVLKNIIEYKIVIFFLLVIVIFAIAIFQPSTRDTNANMSNLTNISIINYTGNCSNCHNNVIPSGVDANKCGGCHTEGHGSKQPSRYTDKGIDTIHYKHSVVTTTQELCLNCHGPPACNRCHKGHVDYSNVSKRQFLEILKKTLNCQECHGTLPDPRGHEEQRSSFYDSMHGWMGKCNTCHDRDENKLRFKDIDTYNRTNKSESALLCSKCHSKQRNEEHPIGVKNSDKGICVNCHNPHGEPKKEFIPRFSFIIETTNKITKGIEDNAFILIIIIFLILSVAFEYATRPKEGNILLSKTLRIEHNKLKTKAIKLKVDGPLSHILNNINDILSTNNAELIGMSGDRNDVVIFVSIDGDSISLLKDLGSIKGISSAEYSEEYEVR